MCGDSKALTEPEDQKRVKSALEVERGRETEAVEVDERHDQADRPPLSKGWKSNTYSFKLIQRLQW